MTHKLEGESLLTRSFLGELDRCQAGPHSGRPLHEAILLTLRDEGCGGATVVVPAIAEFGASAVLHTGSVLRISLDLVQKSPSRIRESAVGRRSPAALRFDQWSLLDSNQRPPRCERGALPTELSDPRRAYVALNTPTGNRTPVFWLRTRYPRPLDDGGKKLPADTDRTRNVRAGGWCFNPLRGLLKWSSGTPFRLGGWCRADLPIPISPEITCPSC